MATLNRAALHYEKRGDIMNSLKAVFLLLTRIKQTNGEETKAGDGEESKETGDN